MFWTILFIALKFIAAILTISVIAEFVTWKAIRDYEAEKKAASKPIDYIPIDFGIYDSKGRIKQSRVELEESMKKWRKEG